MLLGGFGCIPSYPPGPGVATVSFVNHKDVTLYFTIAQRVSECSEWIPQPGCVHGIRAGFHPESPRGQRKDYGRTTWIRSEVVQGSLISTSTINVTDSLHAVLEQATLQQSPAAHSLPGVLCRKPHNRSLPGAAGPAGPAGENSKSRGHMKNGGAAGAARKRNGKNAAPQALPGART
eukprot:gene11549-biopygen19893